MRLMFARGLTVALAVVGGAGAMALPKLFVDRAIRERETSVIAAPVLPADAPVIRVPQLPIAEPRAPRRPAPSRPTAAKPPVVAQPIAVRTPVARDRAAACSRTPYLHPHPAARRACARAGTRSRSGAEADPDSRSGTGSGPHPHHPHPPAVPGPRAGDGPHRDSGTGRRPDPDAPLHRRAEEAEAAQEAEEARAAAPRPGARRERTVLRSASCNAAGRRRADPRPGFCPARPGSAGRAAPARAGTSAGCAARGRSGRDAAARRPVRLEARTRRLPACVCEHARDAAVPSYQPARSRLRRLSPLAPAAARAAQARDACRPHARPEGRRRRPRAAEAQALAV